MNENEIIFDGKKYIAKEASWGCDGCAFQGFGDLELCSYEIENYPSCIEEKRTDDREIIWILADVDRWGR